MNKKIYKLILFSVLFFVGLCDVYGLECYYISNSTLESKGDGTYFATVTEYGTENEVYSFIRGNSLSDDKKEISNYGNTSGIPGTGFLGSGGYTFPAYNNSSKCPDYLVYLEYHVGWGNLTPFDYPVVTDNIGDVNGLINFVNKEGYRDSNSLHGVFIATSKKPGGGYYTKTDYENAIASNKDFNIEIPGYTAYVDCSENSLFGNPNEDGSGSGGVPSLAYIIKLVLTLVRWVVPILIICLGTIDLFTAVISDKEDKMVEAQKKLIKRIIAGVCVFFVPTFVSLLMELANGAFVGPENLLEGEFCYFDW